MEAVKEFKYLGTVLCKHGEMHGGIRVCFEAQECGKYRGIRLLEHGMKLFEKVLEERMEVVKEFRYLGTVLCKHGEMDGEISES